MEQFVACTAVRPSPRTAGTAEVVATSPRIIIWFVSHKLHQIGVARICQGQQLRHVPGQAHGQQSEHIDAGAKAIARLFVGRGKRKLVGWPDDGAVPFIFESQAASEERRHVARPIAQGKQANRKSHPCVERP